MNPESLLRAGDVAGCLASLKERVRKDPADPKQRIFLFQVYCLLGEWKRALTQLSVLGEMDGGTLGLVATYRTAIACEALREEVFAGKRTPIVFGEPPPWVALLIEALRLRAAPDPQAAVAARDRAFDLANATPGAIDDACFAWLADGDTRLGPVLETFLEGRYVWIPFERIAAIAVEPPADLRDLIWAPVEFTWTNGGRASGFVPTRYPGTPASADEALLLARRTEWTEIGPDDFAGLGQRVLVSDLGEHSLLDVRSIRFGDAPEDAATEGSHG